jgi:aspartyl/asparaginyl-tRNA synthetase
LQQAGLTTWDNLLSLDTEASPSTDPARNQHNVKLCGYVTSQRSGRGIDFVQLVDPSLKYAVQLVVTTRDQSDTNHSEIQSRAQERRQDERHHLIKSLKEHTPVKVVGSVVRRQAPPKSKSQPQSSDESRTVSARNSTHTWVQSILFHSSRYEQILYSHSIHFHPT